MSSVRQGRGSLVTVGRNLVVPFLQPRCKNTNVGNEQYCPDRDQSKPCIAFKEAISKYAEAGSAVGYAVED